ncbi:hypothetical protein ACFL3V_00590 [Nanoarchaeota archaeon]
MIGPKRLTEEDKARISKECSSLEAELELLDAEAHRRYFKLLKMTQRFDSELTDLLKEHGTEDTIGITKQSVTFNTFIADGRSSFGERECRWIHYAGATETKHFKAMLKRKEEGGLPEDYQERLDALCLNYARSWIPYVQGTSEAEDAGLREIPIIPLQLRHQLAVDRLLGLTVVEDTCGQDRKDTALLCITDPKLNAVSIVEANIDRRLRISSLGIYYPHYELRAKPEEPTITTIMRQPEVAAFLYLFSHKNNANVYVVHHPSTRFFVDAIGDHVCSKMMGFYSAPRRLDTPKDALGARLGEELLEMLRGSGLAERLQDAEPVFSPSIYRQEPSTVEPTEEEKASMAQQVEQLREVLVAVNTEAKRKSEYVNRKTAEYQKTYRKTLTEGFKKVDGNPAPERKVHFNPSGIMNLPFDDCVCKYEIGYTWWDRTHSFSDIIAKWQLEDPELPAELFEDVNPGFGNIWMQYVNDVRKYVFGKTDGDDVSEMGVQQLSSKAGELKRKIEAYESGELAAAISKN